MINVILMAIEIMYIYPYVEVESGHISAKTSIKDQNREQLIC